MSWTSKWSYFESMFIVYFLMNISSPKVFGQSENSTDFIATESCVEKYSANSSNINSEFELVETSIGGKVKLACHFCGENDDLASKMWYKHSVFGDKGFEEVELGMGDVLQENRLYMTPDHSLFINQVKESDSGIYYCRGIVGEDVESNFTFLVDVVKPPPKVTVGKPEEWENFKTNSYKEVSKLFSTSNRSDYEQIRNMSVQIKPSAEWLPWGICDGCRKIRSRISGCRLKPILLKNSTFVIMKKNNLTDEEPRILNYSDENSLLFKLFEISCFSLEFEKMFPNISRDIQSLGVFMIFESCYAPCRFQFKSSSLPRYKNTLTLKEGDHFTLICPEKDSYSEISWRKDGILINPLVKSENILIDTSQDLRIIDATEDVTGNYTCYIGNVRMHEVLIIVDITPVIEGFKKNSIYLGIIFLIDLILYISALVISWNRRHNIENIAYTPIRNNV